MIPYGKQEISEDDINAVVAVLRSDFLTQGPMVPLFENSVAAYCNSSYAIAVNSATSALHIACLALSVGSGDILWTTPITFVASANCELYCGASVDFVDIDPSTYNISVECLKEKLILAKAQGKLPKVLVVVHMCGQSCDMASIFALANKYDFKIIEDASHAIGGKYQDVLIGSCLYSDITIFSFHPVKIITTGEGGVAVTNNIKLAEKMRLLRSHGITREPREMEGTLAGPWYYEQIELGFNYRMTDIQAALGVSQLQRINTFVAKRQAIAANYEDLLQGLPIQLPKNINGIYNSYHLYIIRLVLNDINKTHKQVFQELRDCGIGVNLHYIPVYLQPYYKKLGFIKGYCKEAEKYYSEAISLPIYPGLLQEEQLKVVNSIKEILAYEYCN